MRYETLHDADRTTVYRRRRCKPALAARFYASESVFALERERLFHAQWFCVGRAEQVPTRGDCLHVHVAGESVLILRGKDDSAARRSTTSAAIAAAGWCARRRCRIRTSRREAVRLRCPPASCVPITRGLTTSMARCARHLTCRFDASMPEGGLLARAGPRRYLGRLHLRESRCDHAGAAVAGAARGARAASSHAIRSRICGAARSSSTTCAPTGK